MNKNKVIKIAIIVAAIIIFLLKVVIPSIRYNEAIALMNEGKYEEAMTVFGTLYGYKDSYKQESACRTIINDKAYDEAVTLMNEGKYKEALAAFDALDGYRDSAGKARTLLNFQQIKAAEVGDYIKLGGDGYWRQIYDTSYYDTKYDIEWLVLEREGNKLFVISKYVLDYKLYNDKIESVTWETCTLRKWLNGTFLDKTFSELEQRLIQTTEVPADKNPDYGTSQGEVTNDRIFLLSIDEANKYFASDKARICENDNGNACSWWLRSPGVIQQVAACVITNGKIDSYGDVYDWGWQYEVTYVPKGVRPAMWIDLNA